MREGVGVLGAEAACITPPVGSLTVPWTVPAPPNPCAKPLDALPRPSATMIARHTRRFIGPLFRDRNRWTVPTGAKDRDENTTSGRGLAMNGRIGPPAGIGVRPAAV